VVFPRSEVPDDVMSRLVRCYEVMNVGESSMKVMLPRSEGDDASHGVVGRDTDGYPIPRNHLDAETPHPSAQLCENLVSCVALDAIQTPGVDGDDRTLHIYEIVFAQ
jgi:hypothetical protein